MTVGDITSSGNGNTKKQAKQAAAKSMLDILDGRAPSGGDGAKPTTAEGGEAKDGEKAAENGKKPAAPQVGNKIGMLQVSQTQTSFFRWFAANIGWFVDN